MIYLNGYRITPTIFPDKTSQVWHIPENYFLSYNEIHWEFENEGEFITLLQLVALLYSKNTAYSLFMPYLPYGRQDKEISNETTFALHPFLTILNNSHFTKVTTIDAHNKQIFESFTGFESLSPKPYIVEAIKKCAPDMLVYPDNGASIRYSRMLDHIPALVMEKIRDPETGHISKIAPVSDLYPEGGRNFLIVDDICDGGMTFIMIAKLLREIGGASHVHLYTTHGIYSKGISVLKDAGIERIFNYIGEVICH